MVLIRRFLASMLLALVTVLQGSWTSPCRRLARAGSRHNATIGEVELNNSEPLTLLAHPSSRWLRHLLVPVPDVLKHFSDIGNLTSCFPCWSNPKLHMVKVPEMLMPMLAEVELDPESERERKHYFLSLMVLQVCGSVLLAVIICTIIKRLREKADPEGGYSAVSVVRVPNEAHHVTSLPLFIHLGIYAACFTVEAWCAVNGLFSDGRGLVWEVYAACLQMALCLKLALACWVCACYQIDEVPGTSSIIAGMVMPISPLGELFDMFKDSMFTTMCLRLVSAVSIAIGSAAAVTLAISMIYLRNVYHDRLLYTIFPLLKPRRQSANVSSSVTDWILTQAEKATSDEKLAVLLTEDVQLVILQLLYFVFVLGKQGSFWTLYVSLAKLSILLLARIPILYAKGLHSELFRVISRSAWLSWSCKSSTLGSKHPSTLMSMSVYAYSLSELGRYEEAVELDKQCWEMMTEVLGAKHPDTLDSMNKCAISLTKLGRYEEAAELQKQCWEMRAEVLGAKHPSTLISMSTYSISLTKLGRYEEAAELQKQCWEMRTEVLGAKHPETLTSMNNYSISLIKLGRYEEAVELDKQCLEIKTEVLGAKHPSTLTSMNNYSISLSELGRYEEAAELQKQCLQIQTEVLGAKHPETLVSMNNYSISLRQLGHYEDAAVELDNQRIAMME